METRRPSETGIVLDKDAVRAILKRLDVRRGFSEGDLGIEQATNEIGRLQRGPRDIDEVALTECCPYCGRTAGNTCRRGDADVSPHPSRLAAALTKGAS